MKNDPYFDIHHGCAVQELLKVPLMVYGFSHCSHTAVRGVFSYNLKNRLLQVQGVSRLVDITAGGDFLGLRDQKIAYKHVSDFGWLRSYDRLKLKIDGNDYRQ